MRKHLYLITEHDDEEMVGLIKETDSRISNSKKNEERPIRVLDEEEGGFPIVGQQVAFGYVDVEDEDEWEDRVHDLVVGKLSEIDESWLDKAGIEIEVPA